MAARAQPAKNVEDALKNLKIDPSSQPTSSFVSGPKNGSPSDEKSCIASWDASSSIKECEVDHAALIADQSTYYYDYYYPGFSGSFGECDDPYYVPGAHGLEIQHPVAIQEDNGSVLHYMPGLQHGYSPYGTFAPGALGVDGHYLGQQPYYSSPIVQHPFVSFGYFPQSVAYGTEMIPMYQWDPTLLVLDGVQGNAFVDPASLAPKSNFSSQGHKLTPSKTSQSSKSAPEKKGSISTLDVSVPPPVYSQSLKPVNKATAALSKTYLPTNKFQLYPNQGNSGLFFQNTINIKETGCTWIGTEKSKARNKTHGVGSFSLLTEQNRGPRTSGAKDTLTSDGGHIESLVVDGNDKIIMSVATIKKDQYNLPDFPTKYNHALFFVIKSYSEDDIHKSIKYNVWASTPNGNKRLDNAFQVAQDKMAETGSKCPVFLFFSVNASGQFCGVAEMIGHVDFDKSMNFWQQDKWNGFFPVKWHIIKDIPNPRFRHIVLENNENKPVTNSRDTQEVKFLQGIEMLNIFNSYSSKTSILDDFGFYEKRQKAMQENRIKPPTLNSVFSVPKTDGVEVTELAEAKPRTSSQSIESAASDLKVEKLSSGCSPKE